MLKPDFIVFSLLFREAHSRCFGAPLSKPLTEPESKIFQQQLLDVTGLTVGWRSLKNYSLFVLEEKQDDENPSIASMDTLARYVLKAPYTNEIDRKNTESHHPYWYMYRERHLAQAVSPKKQSPASGWVLPVFVMLVFCVLGYFWLIRPSVVKFSDDFTNLNEQVLQERDWQVLNKDNKYWAKRTATPQRLTLFTLPGDNWPDSAARPDIKNLLIRRLPEGCFNTELQLEDFIPAGKWQQAGLLLLEEADLNSRSVRVSLAYNDFFGGFDKPAEILVQAIATAANGGKPEEFIHHTVLTLDSAAAQPVIMNNLKQTALRIEKQGNNFRMLYAGGAAGNAAFKELAVKELHIVPKYVAIFALKGNVPATPVAPVKVRKFLLESADCED